MNRPLRSLRARACAPAAVAGSLLLAACDPAGVPSDPSDASVRVELEPTGEATGHLQLARDLAADLVPAATDVATELVGEPSRVAIDGNGGGAD